MSVAVGCTGQHTILRQSKPLKTSHLRREIHTTPKPRTSSFHTDYIPRSYDETASPCNIDFSDNWQQVVGVDSTSPTGSRPCQLTSPSTFTMWGLVSTDGHLLQSASILPTSLHPWQPSFKGLCLRLEKRVEFSNNIVLARHLGTINQYRRISR